MLALGQIRLQVRRFLSSSRRSFSKRLTFERPIVQHHLGIYQLTIFAN